MAEARKALPKDMITAYHTVLMETCGGLSGAIEATAEQRLLALLKTLNLYVEEGK